MSDLISRQVAIDEIITQEAVYADDAIDILRRLPSAQPERCSDCIAHGGDWECDHMHCRKGRLPSAQSTLHGYNIEHLELIARVLQKENLPPERIVEALTDIGRIVAIVKDEFEETLRKAVEQCTI